MLVLDEALDDKLMIFEHCTQAGTSVFTDCVVAKKMLAEEIRKA